MSNFDRIKKVSRENFETVEEAREVARTFVAEGGKVTEGGERADGLFGWTGEIRVDDTATHIGGNFGCGRCAMTGAFITGTENGKPYGPGGDCFRCGGKGWHGLEDRKRNLGHDMHYIGRG